MTLSPQSYQVKRHKVTKRNATKIPNNLVVLGKSIIFACK
jgi:hypothetical protein